MFLALVAAADAPLPSPFSDLAESLSSARLVVGHGLQRALGHRRSQSLGKALHPTLGVAEAQRARRHAQLPKSLRQRRSEGGDSVLEESGVSVHAETRSRLTTWRKSAFETDLPSCVLKKQPSDLRLGRIAPLRELRGGASDWYVARHIIEASKGAADVERGDDAAFH